MILVTGAAGYIGSHFVRGYLSASPHHQLLAVDDLSTGHREALPDDRRLVFQKLDIGDLEAMKGLLKRHSISAVVHFAGSIFVGESEKAPFKYFENNVVKTLRLLEAMSLAGVSKIVFSSSCAVYGNPEFLPLTEEHRFLPVSIYGQTKLQAEEFLRSLHRTKGLSFLSLRYFNAAGADDSLEIGESHEPETHLIPNVLRAMNGRLDCLEVYGDDYETRDGTCVRDYVHVNDLAAAHMAALELLEREHCGSGINLGTGHGASVREIIELCRQISGRDLKMKVFPRREGDVATLVADYEKASALLGWRPRYELRRIIETAWLWELNRRF